MTSGSAGASEGPVGIITGGLSGIGAATALQFAALGAQLVLVDISVDAGDKLAAEIAAAGGSATVLACDIGDADGIAGIARDTVARLGRIDFLVANAGIAEQSLVETGDPKRWAKVVHTNLLGAMYSARAVMGFMRGQRRGHILIVASLSGRETYVGEPSYIASKWGLIGFAHSLRLEAARNGIRVTIVEPGAVETPLTLGNEYTRELLAEMTPLRPADVARVLVFAYSQPTEVVVSEIVVRPLDELVTGDIPGLEGR